MPFLHGSTPKIPRIPRILFFLAYFLTPRIFPSWTTELGTTESWSRSENNMKTGKHSFPRIPRMIRSWRKIHEKCRRFGNGMGGWFWRSRWYSWSLLYSSIPFPIEQQKKHLQYLNVRLYHLSKRPTFNYDYWNKVIKFQKRPIHSPAIQDTYTTTCFPAEMKRFVHFITGSSWAQVSK